MTIATILKQYLDTAEISYDCIEHPRTTSSIHSAAVSGIPFEQLANGVVLRSGQDYLVAVVPASRNIDLDSIGACLGHPVAMAMEPEIERLFPDCETGAIPPIGTPHGLNVVLDDSFDGQGDVFFEAGDHRTLIHLAGDAFRELTKTLPHERITCRRDDPWQSPDYFGA
jgi:Ala-tRNA(Pro) deacylase